MKFRKVLGCSGTRDGDVKIVRYTLMGYVFQ